MSFFAFVLQFHNNTKKGLTYCLGSVLGLENSQLQLLFQAMHSDEIHRSIELSSMDIMEIYRFGSGNNEE